MNLTNEDRAILTRLPIAAQAEYHFADRRAAHRAAADLVVYGSIVNAVTFAEYQARSIELGRPA